MKVVSHLAIQIQLKIAVTLDSDKLNSVKSLTSLKFTSSKASAKSCRSTPTRGYCDTITDGGGWLVVQRKTNGSENFNRTWNDYEMGFGSLTGELWYGLRALHCLTSSGNWELRIDFTFSNGTKSFMHYNHFRVGPATDNYRLSISGFTGITPTDPFTTHPLNGQQFSTFDRENDLHRSVHCALKSHGSTAPGGWWYWACFHINLNYNYGAPHGFIHSLMLLTRLEVHNFCRKLKCCIRLL